MSEELSLEQRRLIVVRMIEIDHAMKNLSASGLPAEESDRLYAALKAEWERESKRLRPFD